MERTLPDETAPGSADEARKDAEHLAGKAEEQEESATTVVEALNASTLAQLAVAARLGQLAATLRETAPPPERGEHVATALRGRRR